MINRDGKVIIVIMLTLVALILVAAMPWYFIISRNISDPESLGRTSLPNERGDRVEDEQPPEEYEPVPEPEPEFEPEPEPEPERDIFIPIDDLVADIRTTSPELFRELNEIASEYNAVSVSLVIYDGETGEYFTYEYGHADTNTSRPVDAETKFRVASLAKLTTVLCAMVLVDEGLIDLDTDISVYLGYEVNNNNYPGTVITTRMLMQHTSSIFDSGAFQVSRDRNSSESVRFLLERGSSFRRNQPGTTFEYTNFGYSVIGAICENVSGKSLDTLAREVLFDPLGIDASYVPEHMHDTENIAVIYNERHVATRSVPEQLETVASEILGHDLHLAQGNLTISAIDYARILAMLGNGGILRDVRILSAESVRAIHNTNVDGVTYDQGLATRHSSGDFMPGAGFYWHTGSAYGLFAQYIYSDLNNLNRGVVVITTGARADREPNGMVSVCTDLSVAAWQNWDTLSRDPDEEETVGNEDE